MKTKEDIYLDEVKRASEVDERFAKILLSEAIKKFTLNCLMIMEEQYIIKYGKKNIDGN